MLARSVLLLILPNQLSCRTGPSGRLHFHSPQLTMCLLGLFFQTLPDCPLLVVANREEAYQRPASSPRRMHEPQDHLAWLGGIDLQAGGTWLGVNERGVFVSVTNRSKQHVPPAPPSRGLLCRHLLGCSTAKEAFTEAQMLLRQHDYAGFNLLVADTNRAWIVEAADNLSTHSLSPGLILLANGSWNNPHDGRVARARGFLQPLAAAPWQQVADRAKQLCGLHAEGDEPPICLHGEDRGTVSSTILALPAHRSESIYWHAPGPPCRTPYEAYSPALRELLTA